MTRVNDHDIYRHCLKLAKTILTRGNILGQQLFVNVADKKHWETEILRIYQFEGKSQGELANIGLKSDGFVIGDPQPLSYSDDSYNSWNETWTWRRFRLNSIQDDSEHFPLYDLEPQLFYIGQKLNLVFKKNATLNKTRFSIWGAMFEAAIALVEENIQRRLRFRLIHHGGWGTYYFEFYDDENECLFALSEAGHIAGVGSLVEENNQTKEASNNFNLRDKLLSGLTQKPVNLYLQNQYNKLCKLANSQ